MVTLLLYGDAVAHLRHRAPHLRFADARASPQLGSVWLPLPHLLLLPFVQKLQLVAERGSGRDAFACSRYVLSVTGLYRLVAIFSVHRRDRRWLPVTLFMRSIRGCCTLATTAMTEPLFLADF